MPVCSRLLARAVAFLLAAAVIVLPALALGAERGGARGARGRSALGILGAAVLGLVVVRRRSSPPGPRRDRFWYHRGIRDGGAQTDREDVVTDAGRQLVAAALAGDAAAVRGLVADLTPVIQASAARALLRRRAFAKGNDVRQLLDDMVQDVFVELFRDGGKLLRAWDPARGKGLHGFVALVAEQRVGAVLRSRRRNPWSEDLAVDGDDADEPAGPTDPERRIASRQEIAKLFERAHAELTPLGRDLFQRLIVEEEPIAQVAEAMSMSTSAVQAWSSRLKRLLAKLWDEIAADRPPDEKGADA
ncbi:MAG: sigma-70 family RNA polymerase sigma factor [Minicystis sp.]